MQLILADGTSPAHLDGTTTGIVVMVIVMFVALILFISLVYWSARAPRDRTDHRRSPWGRGSAGVVEQQVTSTGGQGAPHLLVNPGEHGEGGS